MEETPSPDGRVSAADPEPFDAEALRRELREFIGTTQYYRHPSGILYTDGIHYLADKTKGYWFLDLVASWQPIALRDSGLSEFQLWELSVREDRSALAICYRDSEDEAFRQEIEFTDFPMDYARLYVEGGVMLLPSEH